KCPATYKLHCEKCVLAVNQPDFVDGNYSWMLKLGANLGLVEEALLDLVVRSMLTAEDLDCDIAAEYAVSPPEYDADTSACDFAKNVVAPGEFVADVGFVPLWRSRRQAIFIRAI
ncbi:MAG TPA: hypothetical protein PKE00_13350, partial [Planctomycetota bacterium]|nr:hypothetical protein [Planctomycetota bacterium]